MFLNLQNLTIEQLIEKQIEIQQKISQAHQLNMSSAVGQLQNMLEQIGIEISAKSQIQSLEKERERKIEEGKDPDDDVLNIG